MEIKNNKTMMILGSKKQQICLQGRRKAFALIEILIVVGILGVMSSVAVPALQKAKANAEEAKRQGVNKMISDAKTRKMLDSDVVNGSVCSIDDIAEYIRQKGKAATLAALQEGTGRRIYNLGTFPDANGVSLPAQWLAVDTSDQASVDAFLSSFVSENVLDASNNLNAIVASSETTDAQKAQARQLLMSEFTAIAEAGGDYAGLDTSNITDEIVAAFTANQNLFSSASPTGIKTNPFQLSQNTIEGLIAYLNSPAARGVASRDTYPFQGVVVPKGVNLSAWNIAGNQGVGIDFSQAIGMSASNFNGAEVLAGSVLPPIDVSAWSYNHQKITDVDFSHTSGMKGSTIEAVGWGWVKNSWSLGSLKTIVLDEPYMDAPYLQWLGFTAEQIAVMNPQPTVVYQEE